MPKADTPGAYGIMASFSRYQFLAIAVVFHFIYIFSIFDIYFVSPIVSGMRLFEIQRPVSSRAPADRLVLFVGMYGYPPVLCAISDKSPLQETDYVPTRHSNRIPSRTRKATTTLSPDPSPRFCDPRCWKEGHLVSPTRAYRPSLDPAMWPSSLVSTRTSRPSPRAGR